MDNELIYKRDAIKALGEEPEVWEDECCEIAERAQWQRDVAAIKAVTSVVLKQKKGKWIKIPEFHGDDVSGFIDNHFSCSECKKEAEINPWGFYILSDFCPNCGADMREGEE